MKTNLAIRMLGVERKRDKKIKKNLLPQKLFGAVRYKKKMLQRTGKKGVQEREGKRRKKRKIIGSVDLNSIYPRCGPAV